MEGILKNLTLFKEGCVFYLFFIEVVDLQCSVNFTVQKVIYIYIFLMVFPVVMYGCESWTIKKAEH